MTETGRALVPGGGSQSHVVRAGVGVTDAFHVFVYGTLRLGGSAAALLDRSARLGAAAVQGTLYDIDGRFPALMLYGANCVHGEVWRCPVELLPSLDEFEGVDIRLFRRVGVRAGNLACWTYVAGPTLARELTPARRIESGEWIGIRD